MIKEDISENSIFKNTLKLLFLLMSCRILKNVLRGLHLQKNSQAKLITFLVEKYLMFVLTVEKNLRLLENNFQLFCLIKITNLY